MVSISKYSFGADTSKDTKKQASPSQYYVPQTQSQDTFVKKPQKDKRNFWEKHLAAILGITSIAFLAITISSARRARINAEENNKMIENFYKQMQGPKKDTEMLKKFEFPEGSPKSLKDVIGMHKEKAILKELVLDPLQSPEMQKLYAEKYKIKLPSGILLQGEPGNGKTFLVEALAGELKTDLYKLNMSDLGSKYIHETGENILKAITEIKEKAKKSDKPIILFLDELDGLTRARTGDAKSHELEELNTILQNINNLQNHNVILIGATNRKDLIDSAILRSGRFGHSILVENPNKAARVEMLQKLLEERPAKELLKNNDAIDKIAEEFDGLSNASMVDIIERAARRAAQERSDISPKHFEEVLKEYKISNIKPEFNEVNASEINPDDLPLLNFFQNFYEEMVKGLNNISENFEKNMQNFMKESNELATIGDEAEKAIPPVNKTPKPKAKSLIKKLKLKTEQDFKAAMTEKSKQLNEIEEKLKASGSLSKKETDSLKTQKHNLENELTELINHYSDKFKNNPPSNPNLN